MTIDWQSRVWYDNTAGPQVTTAFTDPTVVTSNVYWRVHWCDPETVTRVWMISNTGQDPTANCTQLQAAFPGTPVYWGNVPPGELFPVQAGVTPPITINSC
jgi:hypothetical protein